ncbi:MAG TPA: LPXTG cell wall anchor domain-containing protein [Terriglobales bacterium]|jgi:LPXTG-motif cell wall-anchored protein|nr:LPXTG cell wall anchor domain-containing protein [Terriglobales bacterium]
MNWLRYYPYILAGAMTLALGLGVLVRRRRKTPEERERQRRQYINTYGRITIGTVVDVRDIGEAPQGSTQLLIYRYDVSGVSYEAAQDVTYLRHQVDLHSCRLGLPASIKYDPQNPGNSIVVAEGWTGLRS